MDKSFQRILEERLNPREAAPAAAFAPSATRLSNDNPFATLTWSTRAQVKPRTAYARERAESRESARRARRPVTEPLIPLVKLSHEDLDHVRALVELGATELNEGLSARRLKSAYRRLARRHHPDAGGLAATFVTLNDLHGRLLARLPAYSNHSVK